MSKNRITKTHKLTDLLVGEISIVDDPANLREFVLLKNKDKLENAINMIEDEIKNDEIKKLFKAVIEFKKSEIGGKSMTLKDKLKELLVESNISEVDIEELLKATDSILSKPVEEKPVEEKKEVINEDSKAVDVFSEVLSSMKSLTSKVESLENRIKEEDGLKEKANKVEKEELVDATVEPVVSGETVEKSSNDKKKSKEVVIKEYNSVKDLNLIRKNRRTEWEK